MKRRKGAALILTLWVLLVLAILAIGIGTMARTDTQISRNQADVISCRWAARAGIYRAIAELESTEEDQSTYLYLGEDGLTLSSSDDSTLNLRNYEFSVKVEDESGKININTATVGTLTNLFNSSEIADCIIDWRDSDDTISTEGAESEYYEALSTPYLCRNGDFQTVGELKLVKGITDDLMTATTDNGNELEDLITVYNPTTADTNTDNQVDIQTANRSQLQSALGSVLSANDIRSIIDYRNRSKFTNPAQIIKVPGLTRSKVEQIYDLIKVSSSTTQTGLININDANSDVLTALEYLDSDTAEAIVDYRASNGAFKGVGYLLAVSDVTDDMFANAASYFTVRSKLFKITSTGKLTGSEISTSITCIVDLSGTSVSIRYWHE